MKEIARKIDILRTLVAWSPLTATSIFRAGKTFEYPFTTLRRTRETLQSMHQEGLVGRSRLPGTTLGNTPYAYHLKRKASSILPGVADIPRSNNVLAPVTRNPYHAIAIGETAVKLELDAHQHPDVEVLERIRDRQFRGDLSSLDLPQLIPDGALLLRLHGKTLRMIFIEVVNEQSILNPAAVDVAQGRSLSAKIAKYRAFKSVCRDNAIWKRLEDGFGTAIYGFQVLVVSTRQVSQRLAVSATGCRDMVLFADAGELQSCANAFTEPVWWFPRSNWRPDGPKRGSLLT